MCVLLGAYEHTCGYMVRYKCEIIIIIIIIAPHLFPGLILSLGATSTLRMVLIGLKCTVTPLFLRMRFIGSDPPLM